MWFTNGSESGILLAAKSDENHFSDQNLVAPAYKASFNALPGLNLTVLEALILMVSPV